MHLVRRLQPRFVALQRGKPDEVAARRRKQREKRDRDLAAKLLKQVRSIESDSPAIAWNRTLRNNRVGGTVLATAFLILHEAKDYEFCIEGLLAAIRNDHGQPWMYDVLALQMSLAGRPEKEINRVLLSRVDFTDGNEAQMLVTASMLSQFGEFSQALKICREAAKRNPWQVATWTMARSIADRSRDADAIAWSRAGTLRYVWDLSCKTAHAEARAVLESQYEQFQQDGQTARADRVKALLSEAMQRDIQILIKWAGDADLDMSVTEPDGRVCSWKTPLTPNGGILTRQGDGAGLGQEELYVCPNARSGDYIIRVKNIEGRLITGKVLVRVTRYAGTDREKTQSAFYEVGDDELEVKVPLRNGRAE